MSLRKALLEGITAAARIPAPLAVVFVAYLVVALALTAPVMAALDSWLGHRLAARELAQEFDALLLIEPMLQAGQGQAAATTLALMIAMAVAAGPLGTLLNVALGGGVLLTYVEDKFAWRRFLWGAWHWSFAFLALALFSGVCATFAIGLGAGLAIALEARTTALTVPILLATALVYTALAMTFEYARVVAVVEGTRNIFKSVGRAVALIARQPARMFGGYLLMVALGLALIPLYSGILAPLIPFEWGLVGIAAQQLFVAGRLWTRLARWASQVALYRQGIGE